jgi:PPOX class probable F420-dependent enzyme
MSTLDQDALQRFLATRYVAVLSTVQADGSPLAMAMWFLPDRDRLTMISVDGLQKVRNLRRDPRVCVVVESSSARGSEGHGVIVRGRADFLAEGSELQHHWKGRLMPVNRVMFRIAPAHVHTWGLG